MPRKPFQCNPSFPYHLVARSNNSDWFTLSLDEIWDIYGRYLYFIHHAYGVQIHAFVLMNNHFHLIASFPLANLSGAMEYFMRETSKTISHESNRTNHVYGNRIFRSALSSYHYYLNAYKYLLQNPLRANACVRVEDYPYSTIHSSLGLSKALIPLAEDTLLFQAPVSTIRWLNQKPKDDHVDAIRKALRRETFKFPRCQTTKRPHFLEDNLL